VIRCQNVVDVTQPFWRQRRTWGGTVSTHGRYLGKGQQVAIEGQLQTRSWDEEKGTG
jgi:single-stranded DNA-binding protein